MKAALLLVMSLSTGCLWATSNSESVYGYGGHAMLDDHGDVGGVMMDAQGGAAGLSFGVEGNVHDIQRPESDQTATALGLNFDLKGSLFGIVGQDHRLDRYFDIGAELGGGGVLVVNAPHASNPLGASAGYYGAWVELGTVALAHGYLAIVGDIRREGYGAPFTDQTQLTVGLAWRRREPYKPGVWRD